MTIFTDETRSWAQLARATARQQKEIDKLKLELAQAQNDGMDEEMFKHAFAAGADYYKARGYHTPVYKDCLAAAIAAWRERQL